MVQLMLDVGPADGVDLDRLERSLRLHGRRVGEGRYYVTGGSGEHWVDLYGTGMPRCDCGDHLWREQACKHILAALLREGNEHVLAAVGRLIDRAKQSTAAASVAA